LLFVVVVLVLASSSSKKTFSLNFSASLFVFDDDSAEAITLFRFSDCAAVSATFSLPSSSAEVLKTRKARRLLPLSLRRTSATVDDVFVAKSSLLVVVVLALRRSEEEEKEEEEEEYISNNRSLSLLFLFLLFFLGGLCAQMFIHVSDFDDFCHQKERKNV